MERGRETERGRRRRKPMKKGKRSDWEIGGNERGRGTLRRV